MTGLFALLALVFVGFAVPAHAQSDAEIRSQMEALGGDDGAPPPAASGPGGAFNAPTAPGGAFGPQPGGNFDAGAPPPPRLQWGALSAGLWRSRGRARVAVGSAIRHNSEAAARRAALRTCRRAGGRRCRVVTTFSSGCGYITTGASRRGVGWATGRTLARARRKCRSQGYRCKRPIGGCVN